MARRNASVMQSLGLLLVKLGILVCMQPHFLQLMQVEDTLFSSCKQVHVDRSCGPECLVFNFDRKVARLSIHQFVRAHANRCLECGAVGPECIMQLGSPILPCPCHCFL